MYISMDNIGEIVLYILALLVLIIFIGSLYAFFYAIITFIFSAWDAEKIKKAWNSIRYMILWIVLTLFVLFLFPVILKRSKVPWYDMYSASNIFEKVSKITWWLLDLGWEAISTYRYDSSWDTILLAPLQPKPIVPWNTGANDYDDYEL